MCAADENSITEVTRTHWLELDLCKIQNAINHNLSAHSMLKIDTLGIRQ